MSFKKQVLMLVVSAVMGLCMIAEGSGFTILEQSTAGLGRSLAGMTVDINEPGALYFNPSVSSWFDTTTITAGINMLHVKADISTRPGTSDWLGDYDGGNGGGWASVPNFYMVHPITEDIALGLDFSATSGTATRWSKHSVVRYESVDCEISVVEFAPSISWKLLDNLSIGASLIVQYADVEMTRAVPTIPGVFQDGWLKLKGDSWALGYQLGVTYQPFEKTRLGLSYRSRMTQELEQDGRMTKMPSMIGNRRGDADADLDLPAVVNFGIWQDLNERWAVMADVSWTKASQFDALVLEVDPDSSLAELTGDRTVMEMKWKDTWRFSLGTQYKYSEKLTLRAGAAYDRTPIPSPAYRQPVLPDVDRYWFSVGASYQVTKNIRLDAGYVRLLFDSDYMDLDRGSYRVVTKCTGHTDIYSLSLTYTF